MEIGNPLLKRKLGFLTPKYETGHDFDNAFRRAIATMTVYTNSN